MPPTSCSKLSLLFSILCLTIATPVTMPQSFAKKEKLQTSVPEGIEKLPLSEFFKALLGNNITIFQALGAYDDYNLDDQYFSGAYPKLTKYSSISLAINSTKDSCFETDLYNLENRSNIFDSFTAIMSFSQAKLHTDIWEAFKSLDGVALHPGNWFKFKHLVEVPLSTNVILSHHMQIMDYSSFGKSFACATTLVNHAVGNFVVEKHFIPMLVKAYKQQMSKKPQKCFDEEKFTPKTFRLYNKDECSDFIRVITSSSYEEAIKRNPTQYVIKVGSDSVQGVGVFLLDNEQKSKILQTYGSFGENCGQVRDNKIAQYYLNNPLLLKKKKFDFRVYAYIVSVNPLIVYYHDGYERLSIFDYDPNSNDRKQHLTNNVFAEKIIKDMKKNDSGNADQETIDNLEQSTIWNFEELQTYLHQERIESDPEWLKNYLRPQLKQKIIHYIKMIQPHLGKYSNTFDYYGFDFMMTEDLNLWLIEVNDCPANYYLRKDNFFREIWTDRIKIMMAYYRSRMERVFKVLEGIQQNYRETGLFEIGKWREEYKKANINKLEPKYEYLAKNSFDLIIDENLPPKQAYFGNLDEECV